MNFLIKEFNKFILENVDTQISLIEDCFLNFCDEYNLDIIVDKGYFCNDISFVTREMLPELLAMARSENKRVSIKDVCRISMHSKNMREIFGQGRGSLDNKWKDSINNDLNKCISRIETMSNNKLIRKQVPILNPKFWAIIFYMEII